MTQQKDYIKAMQEKNTEALQSQIKRLAQGRRASDNKIYIKTENAKNVLLRGLVYFLGEETQWLPEYDAIAEWLSDNQGRGLLCLGNCGRGKTVITQQILPLIFEHWHRLIQNNYTALDLIEKFDEVRQWKIICIDDVGTEPLANKYGEKHEYLSELVDEVERKDKLIIISTNLNAKELRERYGERVADRLRKLTTQVVFKGKSLRK